MRTVRSQLLRTVRTERKMTQRVNFRSKTQSWLVIDRSGALASAGAVAWRVCAAFSTDRFGAKKTLRTAGSNPLAQIRELHDVTDRYAIGSGFMLS